MRRHSDKSTWFIFLGLGLVACPNPADKAPEAQVGEAKPLAAASKPSSQPSAAGQAPAAKKGPDDGQGLEVLAISKEGSEVKFVGSKVTGTHDGGFKGVSGKIHLDPKNLTASKVEVSIDMKTVWSDDEKLTGHLKSADFFDVEKHPVATFRSTKIVAGATPGAAHTLTGNLQLHGVTKPISFPATISVGAASVTAESEFSLNRKDFGIVYPGKPDDLIRDAVLIKLKLKAPRSGSGQQG